MTNVPIPLIDPRGCPGKRSMGSLWGICIACTLHERQGPQIEPAAHWDGTGANRTIVCHERRVDGHADSEGGEG